MIKNGLSAFEGKKILLLQGPVGPFFSRLARDLEEIGAQVYKVNFNGGDYVFYPKKAISYHSFAEDWPEFFDQLLLQNEINLVLLFGDCRSQHRVAHEISRLRGVSVGVFEEGYIRPDFVTLENHGVNNNSLLPRDMNHYLEYELSDQAKVVEVGKTFGFAAMWAMLYYTACTLMWPIYWRYQHHRSLNLLEGLYWVRSFWRKRHYKRVERNVLKDLSTQYHGHYFIVPLQVHNDAQIYFHSQFISVRDFIRKVMRSFSQHADNQKHLVIKHHPLDRGYHDYTKYIAKLARLNGLEGRVHYIHDQHLPSLFNSACGVVVVNSTVGFSALHHGLPVKVCGQALYDLQGLTFQGTLDQFWQEASTHQVDQKLHNNFRHYLIDHTQLNGSFYKRLDIKGSHTGIIWKN